MNTNDISLFMVGACGSLPKYPNGGRHPLQQWGFRNGLQRTISNYKVPGHCLTGWKGRNFSG